MIPDRNVQMRRVLVRDHGKPGPPVRRTAGQVSRPVAARPATRPWPGTSSAPFPARDTGRVHRLGEADFFFLVAEARVKAPGPLVSRPGFERDPVKPPLR